jgi:hypothetical protein
LRLGQFQHALAELLVWIDKTDATLDELKPVAGDPQVLEVELAKLKVNIIFRGCWCHVIVLNVHAPMEDKIYDVEDSFLLSQQFTRKAIKLTI